MSNECMILPHGPIKTCRHCGKEFVPQHQNCVYCSDECKREHYREYQRDYRQVYKSGTRSLPRGRTLAEISKKAKARGMSYGQYVANINRRGGHE